SWPAGPARARSPRAPSSVLSPSTSLTCSNRIVGWHGAPGRAGRQGGEARRDAAGSDEIPRQARDNGLAPPAGLRGSRALPTGSEPNSRNSEHDTATSQRRLTNVSHKST